MTSLSPDREIPIPIEDGLKIYTTFNPAASPARRLIILSHGLTGRPNEFLHVMARRAFNAGGYDVARPWYYHWPEDARDLVDCTLKIHAQDLTSVVQHFRPHYDRVFVAGHSYGGFSMAHAFAIDGGRSFNPDALSFWDATFTPGWWRNTQYWPESDTFSYRTGQGPRMGRAMFEEAQFYAEHPPTDLYGQITIPSQVILALENEKQGRGREHLFNALVSCSKKEQIGIIGANHEFTTGDTVEQLISHTLRWFDLF